MTWGPPQTSRRREVSIWGDVRNQLAGGVAEVGGREVTNPRWVATAAPWP